MLCAGLLLGFGAVPAVAAEEEPGAERIAKAVEVLREMIDLPDEGLPSRILEKCHGIAVIPGVIKAAYGFGGQYGRGLVVVRNEDGTWSNPAFISLIGGSLGWQIGVQKADIVLVFKTSKSIDNIAEGKVTLGADLSVAAGPVGRSAEASTDLDMRGRDLFVFEEQGPVRRAYPSRARPSRSTRTPTRLFTGTRGSNARDILYDRKLKAPDAVEDLKKALRKRTAPRI